MTKSMSLDEIKKLYNNNVREILDTELREYGTQGRKARYIKYKCLVDSYEGWQTLDSMRKGHGCLMCSGQIVSDKNRLSLLRPDLIKYFKNPDDSNNYSVSSDKKIKLVCPICKKEKNTLCSINTLSRQGFSCEYCSDKISTPEKFGINFCKELNLQFETQKVFDWSKGKRYDLFFNKNNEDFLIEVHGAQHYDESNRGRSLSQEQENDTLKEKLAKENGIKNYIVVDCRISEFEWLRENYIKSFSIFFDLSLINWKHIWEECQNSLMVEVCEAWEIKTEKDTVTTFSNKFGVNRSTIRRYLVRGNEIGLCNYDPVEEQFKNVKRTGKNSKTVYQYSLDGKLSKSGSLLQKSKEN